MTFSLLPRKMGVTDPVASEFQANLHSVPTVSGHPGHTIRIIYNRVAKVVEKKPGQADNKKY